MNKIYWLHPEDTKLGHWQRKIETLSGSSTFCVLPWIHFATRPNGDMRLCCNANSSGAGDDHEVGLVKNESGRPANFGRETPMSAWNNEYMRSVRTTMLKEEIPASCKKCFDEESNGVVSKRIWETGSWIEEDIDVAELIEQTEDNGTVPEKLVYLDLRLGHTCNLKCVMCSPHDSSLWVSDHKKIYPLFKSDILKKQMRWDKKEFNNKWHENPDFWKEMYAQIPNLRQVYFAGGEPLLIKEHKLFLEEIIRQGYADKILVRYNTNGLLVDDEIIELWKKFKKVKVGFSIDAVGDRNWYIRYPSNWAAIERNLHKLDNTPDNIQVSIATAIQILNIKHLPEFAKWKIQQNFKKVNFENVTGGIQAGGGIINMHLLYIPTFLSIRCLPDYDKEEVRKSFADLATWLYNNYRQDEDFWKHNPYGWKRWQAILDFMDAEDHTDQLPDFKEYIEQLDLLRSTDFKKIFPELENLLSRTPL
jgi:sulfatase maturation enzyme AslB (radical SAM superfamily)